MIMISHHAIHIKSKGTKFAEQSVTENDKSEVKQVIEENKETHKVTWVKAHFPHSQVLYVLFEYLGLLIWKCFVFSFLLTVYCGFFERRDVQQWFYVQSLWRVFVM